MKTLIGRDSRTRPGDRHLQESILLVLYGLLSAAYVLWTWNHELGDTGGDSAVYALTARYLSPWSPPSPVAAFFAAHNPYPPLYPALLAILGGGESVLVAHLATTTFLLVSVAALYVWMRTLNLGELTGGLLSLMLMLLPGTYFLALFLLSENLYLLFSLTCLAAVGLAEARQQDHWLWLAAAAAAAAIMTRTAGIALLAAFVVYLLLHRPRRYLWFLLLAAAPPVLWHVFGQQGVGYLPSLLHKYQAASFGTLASSLKHELYALWIAWFRNFTMLPAGAPGLAIVGLVCLTGVAYRLYQLKLDGFYAAAYLLMITLWPYPAEAQRIMQVIVPVVFVQGWLLMRLFTKRFSPTVAGLVQSFYPAVVILVVLPSLALTLQRYLQPVPSELADFSRSPRWYAVNPRNALADIIFDSIVVGSLRAWRSIIPEHECVYSIKPSVVGFYADRVGRGPPGEALSDQQFSLALRQSGCRWFYLVQSSSPSFDRPFYPLDRLRNSLEVLRVANMPGPTAPTVAVLARLKDGGVQSGDNIRDARPSD